MTFLRLGLAELRRLTAGRLARAALVAMITIPMIYAGLYLYANKDPYGSLPNVPAAVVIEDSGTTLANGERMAVGAHVAHDLVTSRSFAWQQVSRSQAEAGVDSGAYDFAIVVPPTFSADLASSAQFTPRQARLELVTNDANNYLARTIANQLVAQVTKSVAGQVSSTTAQQLLLGFTTVHSSVAKAVDGATQLQGGIASARTGSDQLASGASSLTTGQQKLVDGSAALASGAGTASGGATRLASGASTLATGLGTLDAGTGSLSSQTATLAAGAQQVADGDAKIAGVATQVAVASQQLVAGLSGSRTDLDAALVTAGLTPTQMTAVHTQLDRLTTPLTEANTQVQQTSSQLAQLSAGAAQVATGAQTLAASAGPLHDGIHQAATGAGTLRDGATTLASGAAGLQTGAQQLQEGERTALSGSEQLAAGATRLQTGLGTLGTGAASLHDGLASGLKQIPNPSEASRTAVAQTIGDPLTVENAALSSAGSYGAGLAPFFLSLALWIGAYTLFLIVKPLSTRAIAARQPALRVALGGWLAPAVAGTIQALIAYAVVAWGLRIDVAHPLGTIGLMVLTSVTFVAILQALAARLGAVGKFLGLVLMVVQLVSVGGTFPWQTLPGPLQAVHHVVPMSYAIDGVRRLMYGADLGPLGTDVAVLTAYLAGALVLATWAARKARIWTPARLKPELSL